MEVAPSAASYANHKPFEEPLLHRLANALDVLLVLNVRGKRATYVPVCEMRIECAHNGVRHHGIA